MAPTALVTGMISLASNKEVGEPNAAEARVTGHAIFITPGGVTGGEEELHTCVVCGNQFAKAGAAGPWSAYDTEKCRRWARRARFDELQERVTAAEAVMARFAPFMEFVRNVPALIEVWEKWEAGAP